MSFSPLPLRTRLIALLATIATGLALAVSAQAAPLFVEDFSYANNTPLAGTGGWSAHSGAGANPQTVRAPGLSYSCYIGSGVGNADGPLATSGEDVNHLFTGITTGAGYSAFMINVASSQTPGDYLYHFFDGPIASNAFRGRVFIKKDPGGPNFAFGLQFGSSTLTQVFTPFIYTPGTTYLVALKYEYVAGASNDIVRLYVNPVPGAAEPAATLTTSDATQLDATNLDAVGIRQGTGTAAAVATVDGIRVADNWADAVAAASYTITSSAGAGGSIAPSGATPVACGGSQGYSITADPGYQIADVLVDGVSQGPVAAYAFNNVQANHTIDASFSLIPTDHTITASAGAGGSISPNGPVTVANGADQTFTIAADDKCHSIADVLVDGVSVGPVASYTFTNVTADHTIDASFSANGPYTINASAGPGGSIAPSGPTPVGCGTDITFTITPNDKCTVISDVVVDGNSVGAVSTYEFTDVQANHTITASFAPRGPFTITATAGAGGTISPSGPQTVACGGSQSFSISAAACRQIADVKVDGVSQGPISSYTFSDVQANHTIAATFSVINYTILATAGPGGDIDPSGAQTVACGGNKTFNMLPNPGSVILDVLVDAVSQGPLASYTFTNVQSNHTIQVLFEDHAPPSTRLIYPNGGENLFVGDPSKIAWTAEDNFFVSSIDLYVSRFSDSGPWELIASGLPNNGTYIWPAVTGPGTNVDANPNYSAYFRVDAHDDAGFSATDNSDAGVSLYDFVTETLVSMFEAAPLAEGVELRWEVAHAELFSAVQVQRGTTANGPWSALAVAGNTVGGVTHLVDLTAEEGVTYFYRLQVTTPEGQTITLGNLSVQAGIAVKEFELTSVGPNPMRNNLSISYSVAKEANVSLSVLDVQGRTVADLASGTFRPGRYSAVWNGTDNRGTQVPAGMYFVRYQMPGKFLVKRVVMAR